MLFTFEQLLPSEKGKLIHPPVHLNFAALLRGSNSNIQIHMGAMQPEVRSPILSTISANILMSVLSCTFVQTVWYAAGRCWRKIRCMMLSTLASPGKCCRWCAEIVRVCCLLKFPPWGLLLLLLWSRCSYKNFVSQPAIRFYFRWRNNYIPELLDWLIG